LGMGATGFVSLESSERGYIARAFENGGKEVGQIRAGEKRPSLTYHNTRKGGGKGPRTGMVTAREVQ